jgi:hypothetical protein
MNYIRYLLDRSMTGCRHPHPDKRRRQGGCCEACCLRRRSPRAPTPHGYPPRRRAKLANLLLQSCLRHAQQVLDFRQRRLEIVHEAILALASVADLVEDPDADLCSLRTLSRAQPRPERAGLLVGVGQGGKPRAESCPVPAC